MGHPVSFLTTPLNQKMVEWDTHRCLAFSVMVVADDDGQPPASALVLPQLRELGIAFVIVDPRMAEPVDASLQRAVVLHRKHLNAHQITVHLATNVLLDSSN